MLVALGYYILGFFASMKLTEYPERQREMKNYNSRRRNLTIYLAGTFIALTFTVFTLRGSSMPLATTIFATAVFTALLVTFVMWPALDGLQQIPNGLPRPEDELPRKKLFVVYSRVDSRLLLWSVPGRDGRKPLYWEFENLSMEVEPGKVIVYLDDLESEYLAKWKEEGVIPILSAHGRAKMETKKDRHTEERNKFSEAMS